MEQNHAGVSGVSGEVPPNYPFQTTPPPTFTPIQPPKKHFTLIFLGLALLFICGGTVFAYFQKVGPFAPKGYSEENFLSGILSKASGIDSGTYTVSGSLAVVPRSKGALPFTVKTSNTAELQKQYYYDSERLTDARSIISQLNSVAGYSTYYGNNNKNTKSYPSSITDLFSAKNSYSSYSGKPSLTDPVTNANYDYKVTDGGKNFLLTVTFQTDDAIKAIKNYGYVATSTIITGKKVSFTKNTQPYLYMASEPPKPFLVEMSDSLRELPADINVKLSFRASTDFKTVGTTNWLANIDAEGDFGDLTYKVNADAIKKGNDYYFKINNIPSLFLFGEMGNIKGKWVYVSSKLATSTNDGYSTLSYLKTSLPETEKSYKENREKLVKFLKEVITIASEEKLILFRKAPSAETVDGRNLVRYELSVRKDSILPFYTKVQEKINSNPDYANFKDTVDEGLVQYLQSKEFSDVFDYFDKYNTLVVWTDADGYPAIVQNTMHVIPPDTATQLSDKQIDVTLKLVLTDINKSFNIQAPKDSVPIDKIISDSTKNAVSLGQDASTKADLNSVRAYAELAYDKINSYGKKPFTLGPCKKTADTLFADENISKLIDDATSKSMSKATCVTTGTTGQVTSYAISAPLPSKDGFSWCIDSTGSAKEIIGKLTGDSCR